MHGAAVEHVCPARSDRPGVSGMEQPASGHPLACGQAGTGGGAVQAGTCPALHGGGRGQLKVYFAPTVK